MEALLRLLLLLFTILYILINLDHVHALVDLHPDNNISAFIGSLKSASSRILRKEFETHLQQFYSKPILWSGSYYVASTGGAPIEKIKAYIKSQEPPD